MKDMKDSKNDKIKKAIKKKLAILNHKLAIAKNIQKHLNLIYEKKEAPPEEERDPLSPEQQMHQRRVIREKSLVEAVSKIPEYKSSEYYQLDIINRKTKNMNVFKSPNDTGVHGLIHINAVKFAKRRLSQILTRLIVDINKSAKKDM